MKLYFMKKDALEKLKDNLKYVYPKYFTDKTNGWIEDVCGENPFVEFKEVPDFELAKLGDELTKGEIDFINCKTIYKNLKFLTKSQASDERVWAGLTHTVFYDYMRRRWGYDKNQTINEKKDSGAIKSRFFFVGGTRAGCYRNTLAKCWWVGAATYDKTAIIPFEKLDILGSSDLSSKISEIFYSNTYSSNPKILDGIIQGIKYFRDEKINLSIREHIRPTLKVLNAIGGDLVLDSLDKEEIEEIFVENILGIIQGDKQGFEFSKEDYLNEDEEDVNNKLNDEGNQEELCVALGDNVKAKKEGQNKIANYKIDYIKNGKIPPLVAAMLGAKHGEVIEFNDGKYTVLEIIRNHN